MEAASTIAAPPRAATRRAPTAWLLLALLGQLLHPAGARNIIVPHENHHNTFVGYFPMHVRATNPAHARRKKVGMLLGKEPVFFEGDEKTKVIAALLKDGFGLVTTSAIRCGIPS